MILFPAIDIRDGHAVRLRQGRFEDETVYADDPLEAARSFADAGARYLHMVDLDGARDGAPANLEHLRRVRAELALPVQWGGGLRSSVAIDAAFDAGADRVIVGTAAYNDRTLLDEALARWGDRIVVGVDVREGRVSVSGWTEATSLTAPELIEGLLARGVRRFVHTNADRDGMLDGVDLDEVQTVAAAVGEGKWVISGGVGSLDDMRAVHGLGLSNVEGVISGKALYEGRFTVAQAQAELDGTAA